MEDTIKYFKYAMLFPIIVALFTLIVVICALGNQGIIYGGISSQLSGNFIWPVPNCKIITSYFGKRNSPTKGASSYHQGVDIGAGQGSNVYAVSGGAVTFSGWSSSGGYMIIIEHDNGFDSRYCHMDEQLLVKKDQRVLAGQLIGYVGPKYVSGGRLNGATTGPHLHLGIRKDGEFVNPLSFFDF